MRLIHTKCLGSLKLVTRTIVSQPDDVTWPKDFTLQLLKCPRCDEYPSIDDIKKEADVYTRTETDV